MKDNWRAAVARLVRGITHPEEELSRAQRRVALAWSAARFAGTRLKQHRAPQLAAALAYRTIFSLIPLLVLTLVGLRAFYGEQGIRDVLDVTIEYLGFDALATAPEAVTPAGGEEGASASNGAPVFDARREIERFVDRAVEQVRSVDGRLIAVVGLGVLVYSALSLLFQIESAFNVVCGASRKRRFVSRVTNYWTLATAGALALVVTIAIGDSARTAIDGLPGWLSWAGVFLKWLLGVGVTWLLLMFAYTRMPAVRVYLRPAAVGALVAAVVWEVLKNSVTGLIGVAFAGQVAVYSSLAVIPVSLLWVYLTWLIVLYGLELTHLLQVTPAAVRRAGLTGRVDSLVVVLDVGAVASVARSAARAFEAGEHVSVETLAARTGLGGDLLGEVLENLVEEGVLAQLETPDGEPQRYAMARPAERVMMSSMLRVARAMACTPGGAAERDAAMAVRDAVEEALEKVPLVGRA
ncbi:MAG: YihY/virulence factor BrkB family protein [Planctomycetota bacterium]